MSERLDFVLTGRLISADIHNDPHSEIDALFKCAYLHAL